jgi:hypothetical protein
MSDELGRESKQSYHILSYYFSGVTEEIHEKSHLELSGSEPRIRK